MKYTFQCPQCKQIEEEEMTVADYAEFEAVCERCKVKTERVYEAPVVKGGDDSDEDTSSSCSGSCASCTSCGF